LVWTAPAAAQTLDVRAGRLIDPASGRVLADRRIRIVDGRIAAVEPWQATANDAAVVDWSGFTVLPGLIDLHSHIADGADDEGSDPAAPFKRSEAATILKATAAARTMLRSGFTTVRDVGVYRGLTDIDLRDAINAGTVEGPRMFVAGGYITTPGGAGTSAGSPAICPSPRRSGSASCAMRAKHAIAPVSCSTRAPTSLS
jgi:imidazolonepropionase-like amidohydrolase